MALKGLSGKSVLVTGGAAGIGEATARRLAQEGCAVAVVDIDGERAKALAPTLSEQAFGVKADVGSANEMTAAFDAVLERFGRVDLVVNNAAIPGPMMAFADTPTDGFDKVYAINSRSVFLSTQRAIREFRARGASGSIVNVSALSGLIPFQGLTAYVAAKHAVIGMSKVAAFENAKFGIRVNVVCPGLVLTSMMGAMPTEVVRQQEASMPMGRGGRPEELADVIAWLLSDEASYVNGVAIPVDGGLSACLR